MNCLETKKLIQAYLDGELDAAHGVAIETHLHECANCARVQQQQQLLKSAVGGEALQFKMPFGLRRSIVSELRRTVQPEPRPPFWIAWFFPLGGTALASLLLGFFLAGGLGRSSSPLVGELASDHFRSMMPGHLMDVVSTLPHTVKPWFEGKVDFAPPVKDLAANGFPLTGGRLDYINGRTVVALIYKRGSHIINLYVWPMNAADRAPGAAVTRNGYHLINWTNDGMTFWAVSDLNGKELSQFAEEIRGNSRILPAIDSTKPIPRLATGIDWNHTVGRLFIMSTATITQSNRNGNGSVAETDFSRPVQRPKKSGWKLFREVLEHGGPGYLQFAITNICNAKCDFCGFAVDKFDPKQRRSVTLKEARDVIDIAVRNHIGYLLFVGGEPMAHKDLRAMVRYCAESGINPMICTNGSLWTDQNMRDLASDGLSSVIMSIDSHDVTKHEKNRGLPDVCRKIKHANEVFGQLGIQTTASVTASKLIDDYEKLPDFLRTLGFKSCTFSYPLTSLASSYLSFSDSSLVSYKTEELIDVFEKIKQMKARSGFPVVNPSESLSEMQRHLRKEPEKFGCLGGHKYFYLDWHLNLYRCHAWETPMCNIYEFDQSKLIRDGCTRCMIDCYRDPSVMQFVAISASDAYNNLKKGKVIAAAKNVFDRRNLTSLKAVWDDRKWIGEV